MRFMTASLLLASLGFTACDPDVSAELDLSPEEQVETIAAVAGGVSLFPEWNFIPILLPSMQVHVCDVADAGTDDYVGVRFQVGLPKVEGGKIIERPGIKQFLLDAPGDDKHCVRPRGCPRMGGRTLTGILRSCERPHRKVTQARPQGGGQGER